MKRLNKFKSSAARSVLALCKPDGEQYVFLFTDRSRTEVLQQIGRFAANPDLSLTWYDAAKLVLRLKQIN